MPLYYFDIEDAQGVHRDDTGIDLPNLDAAIKEARRALADMGREILSHRPEPIQDLKILIRDHGEGPIRLALSITTDRLDGAD